MCACISLLIITELAEVLLQILNEEMSKRKGRRHRQRLKRMTLPTKALFYGGLSATCKTEAADKADVCMCDSVDSAGVVDVYPAVVSLQELTDGNQFSLDTVHSVSKEIVYIKLMQWIKANSFSCRKNFLEPADFLGR